MCLQKELQEQTGFTIETIKWTGFETNRIYQSQIKKRMQKSDCRKILFWVWYQNWNFQPTFYSHAPLSSTKLKRLVNWASYVSIFKYYDTSHGYRIFLLDEQLKFWELILPLPEHHITTKIADVIKSAEMLLWPLKRCTVLSRLDPKTFERTENNSASS